MSNGEVEFGITTLLRVFFAIRDSTGVVVKATIERDAWEKMKSSIDNMLKEEERRDERPVGR